ncbi:MAG: OsmC family protein [Pseudomonadota bacterium]
MKIREKTTVVTRVNGAGVSHSKLDASVRDLNFAIDEPEARGGTNTGPSPTETALAALAGCTNVIGNRCAEALGLNVGHLNISIECDFDRRGVTLAEEIDVPSIAVRQHVTCDGPVNEADLVKLAAEVDKYCPLAKLFAGSGTKLETTWAKA